MKNNQLTKALNQLEKSVSRVEHACKNINTENITDDIEKKNQKLKEELKEAISTIDRLIERQET